MARATPRVPGSVATTSRVARVSALMGLKETLPHSLSHISCRMLRTGARTPAPIRARLIALTRAVFSPDGSPSVNRFPDRWRITPGSAISLATYTTHPIARSGPIPVHCAPPGSTLSSRSPSHGSPTRWKYHHGTPFCAVTTAVSGPSSGCMASTTFGAECALSVTITKSCGPASAGSAVQKGPGDQLLAVDQEACAVALHRFQVGAPRDERGVDSRQRQLHPEVAARRPRTVDRDLHRRLKRVGARPVLAGIFPASRNAVLIRPDSNPS